MTSGEIYNKNKNKNIYNKYAIEYINKYLSEINDKIHRPFEMMTYCQRTICEKIDNDSFLIYEGFVEETKYSEGRKIKQYSGEKVNTENYNLDRLIEMFGFEISLNPNSFANREINDNIVSR